MDFSKTVRRRKPKYLGKMVVITDKIIGVS